MKPFEIADGRKFFYQWDLNRRLNVNTDYYEIDRVDFCWSDNGIFYSRYVVDGQVEVPNEILERTGEFKAYGYVNASGEENYTQCVAHFEVIAKPNPENLLYERGAGWFGEMTNTIEEEKQKQQAVIDNFDDEKTAMQTNVDAIKFQNDSQDNRIRNLEKRLGPNAFYHDDAVSVIKPVPVNACEYGYVDSFGGMTYEGLQPTKTTEIRSHGANLIPFPYLFKSQSINNIEFTVQEDGGVYVDGTATANTTFRLTPYRDSTFPLPVNTPLMLSGSLAATDTSDAITLTARKFTSTGKDSVWGDSTGTPKALILEEGESFNSVSIYIPSGNKVKATVYPMLNYGTSAVPYKPYRADPIDTIEIPQQIQNLPGYGEGISLDYYNKVGIENGTYTQTVEDGVAITPIKTPLPVEIDGTIKVEAGGYIEFVTDTGNAAPSTISYLLKETT